MSVACQRILCNNKGNVSFQACVPRKGIWSFTRKLCRSRRVGLRLNCPLENSHITPAFRSKYLQWGSDHSQEHNKFCQSPCQIRPTMLSLQTTWKYWVRSRLTLNPMVFKWSYWRTSILLMTSHIAIYLSIKSAKVLGGCFFSERWERVH